VRGLDERGVDERSVWLREEQRMAVWICLACGVEHPESDAPPATCAICLDERQYVPRTGQAWASLEQLVSDGYRVRIANVEPELFGITSTPEVGIGQQSLLVRTLAGNLLWDPVGFADEEAAGKVLELGPVAAIVASHPHMYGVQVAWSRLLGGAPVFAAEADREWVQRDDPSITYWSGDLEVVPGITLRTVGGHFPGSAVAMWQAGADGRGVLLTGDTIFPGPDGRTVSFMRSYPNRLPLSAAVVDRVANAVADLPFDRLYGNFGGVVDAHAREIVRTSADRYMAWVRGDFDNLT
jgi:glyoxylase-like metal-dependent hydrolase (beta-lactamase superfamily II)